MSRRTSGSRWTVLICAFLGLGIGAFLVQKTLVPSPQPQSAAPESILTAVPSPAITASSAATPVPDLPPDTTLFIPALNMAAPIIQVYLDGQSWDIRNLGYRVGHLQGTSLPISEGNTILSAHVEMADGKPGVFATLKDLHIKDEVILQYGGDLYRYRVTDIYNTTPDDFGPLDATDDQLTLITCGPYDFASNSYPERMVVVAKRA